MNEKTKTNKKEVCACDDCAAANKKNKTWACDCDNDPDFEKLRGVKDGNKCACGC